MRYLFDIGRCFYGISITVLGAMTIYNADFPYMLIPKNHSWIPGLETIAYVSGVLLILAGACIVSKWKIMLASFTLGSALLLIFCFYFIPYQIIVSPNYMQFVDWENAAKELVLCGGAFVIAGCFPEKNKNFLHRYQSKLFPFGTILFSITIISFGIDHYILAREAVGYVPSWIPYRLFWMYFTGTALIGAGLAIIIKIRPALAATLLGTMILTWFIILHIPRVIVAPVSEMSSEITSAFIAFAYSGIAFAIGGMSTTKYIQSEKKG